MMTLFKLRPTFRLRLQEPRELVIERLKERCQSLNTPGAFKMFGEYGELHLPLVEHRLWSPHLSFYIVEDGAARGSLIHGRFAPRLEVWTFVWIVYLFMSFSAFFGLTLAYSQWMLNQSTWGLLVALVGVCVIGVLTGVAAVGQQLSADQMHALRSRLEEVLAAAGVNITTENDTAGAQSAETARPALDSARQNSTPIQKVVVK